MTVPNLTFTELRGVHGAFATGVASQQGALTLPDTWFRPPFWDLLMLQLLRPNSSNLPCLYSTFHLEYPLVLSRFCLFMSHNDLDLDLQTDDLKLCVSSCRDVVPSRICNGSTAIFYQLSYFLTPARQCGKVVALQQVFVYKISIATF